MLVSEITIQTLLQPDAETNRDGVGAHFVENKSTEISACSIAGKILCGYSYDQKQMEFGKSHEDVYKKDMTIALLKKEIESALESLKEVQAEMAKLQDEKEKMLMSEKQNKKTMKSLTTEVLTQQAAMDNFEKQSEFQIQAVSHKLLALEQEQIVQDAGSHWYKTKEVTHFTSLILYSKNHLLKLIPTFRFSSGMDILRRAHNTFSLNSIHSWKFFFQRIYQPYLVMMIYNINN